MEPMVAMLQSVNRDPAQLVFLGQLHFAKVRQTRAVCQARYRQPAGKKKQSDVGREQVNHNYRNQQRAEFPLPGYLLLLVQPLLLEVFMRAYGAPGARPSPAQGMAIEGRMEAKEVAL